MGFSHSAVVLSEQSLLNVVSGAKPSIERSSLMRNENVDKCVPIKYLKHRRYDILISVSILINVKCYKH